jgi:hypothetical protein
VRLLVVAELQRRHLSSVLGIGDVERDERCASGTVCSQSCPVSTGTPQFFPSNAVTNVDVGWSPTTPRTKYVREGLHKFAGLYSRPEVRARR